MERLKTIGLWIGVVVPMVLFFGGIFVYAWVKGSFLGVYFFVCYFWLFCLVVRGFLLSVGIS